MLTGLLALSLAAGCGQEVSAPSTPTETPDAPSTPTGAPATPPAMLPPAPSLGLEPAFVAELPTDLVARPGDDRLYVTERAGRVVVFQTGTAEPVATLVDLSDEVGTTHDQALMSLAFDPEGTTLYVHFSRADDGASVLRRYRLDGDRVTGSDDLAIVEQPFPDHNGGTIRFGPDGHLYWALGDGGGEVDAMTTAQDTTNLLGSMLRLDVSGDTGYTVPADNPLVDRPGADEIWMWGLRNPWRHSFDPATGDLWVADVGLLDAEEINRLTAASGIGRGANLGWPLREGTIGEGVSGGVDPVLEYDHAGGRCSITGGEVYRGGEIADLDGEYLFADFCSGELLGYRPGPDPRFTVYEPTIDQPVGFGTGNDGTLYIVSITGDIRRIVAG